MARLVALQALSAWIRSVPVVMSSCYAKSASLCPEWPVGDVPRDMPPEASWTAIRSPRTSTRGVGFLHRLESVYGIARQFLSDEGRGRSRLGVDPGGPRRRKTARKPPGNRRQNRWKTVGKTAGKLPETTGKTVGKTAGKPASNCWKTVGKTAGKPASNRRKTVGKTAGKPASNRRETAGKPPENRWKTAGKPPGNRRETAGRPLVKPPAKAPFLGHFCQSQ